MSVARGWAVIKDGEIDMRTVGPTRRSAIVNWLYVGARREVLQVHTDEMIERMWEVEHGTANVVHVIVTDSLIQEPVV